MNLKEKFTLTEDHLKLAKRSHFGHDTNWFQFGGAAVGQKRPYGNSDIVGDIIEILGWSDEKEWNEEDGYWSFNKQVEEKALAIHSEMATVFQIAACTLSWCAGVYECENDCDQLSWRRIG